MIFPKHRDAVGTTAVAGIVVSIIVVAAVGYYFLGMSSSTGTTSSKATASTTSAALSIIQTSASSQVTTSSLSSPGGSSNIIMVLNPSAVYVSPGRNETYATIKVVPRLTSGTSILKLKLTNLPQGVTGSISPNSVDLTQGSQAAGLSLSLTQSVKPGAYQFAVNAVAGSTNETQVFAFTVVEYLVYLSGLQYLPSEMTIPMGTTVTWMNLEGVISQYDLGIHNVAFTSGTTDHSSDLSQFQVFSYTFNQAGTYTYYCYYHPDMKGQIVVTS